LARLIIVSNRLPVKVTKRKSRLVFQSTIGGLATGLASFYKNQDGVWIGWPGLSAVRLTKSGKAEVRSFITSLSIPDTIMVCGGPISE
jgi:trehalose-6-phosphate synthase